MQTENAEKNQNLSNIVLNKKKKSGEKQKRNYISNLKKQNEELKLKVKLFTNKNQRLNKKLINPLKLWLKMSLKIIQKRVNPSVIFQEKF